MIGITLQELKKVTRGVAPIQKLLVIEEECFEMGNVCYQNFMTTGSLKDLRAACTAHRASMQSMRDKIRYYADVSASK